MPVPAKPPKSKTEPDGLWAIFSPWFHSPYVQFFLKCAKGAARGLLGLCKALPGFAKGTFWVFALVVFIGLLIAGLIEDTTYIEEISVPEALKENGYTPVITAYRLRDELDGFENEAWKTFSKVKKKAVVLLYESEKKLNSDRPEIVVPSSSPWEVDSIGPLPVMPPYESAYKLNSERPEIVVPSTGLSINAIIELIRSLIPPVVQRWLSNDIHRISGEVSEKNGQFRLHVRFDKRKIYNGKDGVNEENIDNLFVHAVPEILRATRPHLLMLAEEDSVNALDWANEIVPNERDIKVPDELFARAMREVIAAIGPHVRLLAEEDWEKALEKLDSIIARLPPGSNKNTVRLLILKGEVYRKKKQFRKSTESLKKAIGLAPGEPSPHVALGLTLDNQGEHDDAIASYDAAIRLASKDYAALSSRGNARVERKEYSSAITDYRDATRIDPKDSKAFYNLGLAYLYNDEKDRAIGSFDDAIRLDPTFALAYTSRGTAYLKKGDNDRAIADYTEAIRLDPKLVLAHNNRGIAFAQKREFDRAIDNFTAAIRLDYHYLFAFTNRGRAYFDKGEFQRAIRDQTEAIQLDSRFAQAYLKRGQAHYSNGDFDRAIDDLTEALRLDQSNSETYAFRGFASFALANYYIAESVLGRAHDLAPRNPYFTLWLYMARARVGNVDASTGLKASLDHLDQTAWPYPIVGLFVGKRTAEETLAAAESDDERCEAHFYIGQWRLLQGDRVAAIPSLRAAAQTCPKQFIESAGAEAELKRLADQEAVTSPPQ